VQEPVQPARPIGSPRSTSSPKPVAVADHDHIPVARVVRLVADPRHDAAERGSYAVRAEHRDVETGVEPPPPVAEVRLEQAVKRNSEGRRFDASLGGEA
jgi:hypothetical protein